MQNTFTQIKKNFGFGCMRLPMNGEEVNLEEVNKMVDEFLLAGFNYFDTAHGYIDGKSERALKACLTSRHARSEYILTDKLTDDYFNSEEELRPFFESQLKTCGVEYFDFYLMHAQTKEYYAKFKQFHAYETAFELKREGKIKHVGISFHDTAELLDQILTEYPQVEVVQLQLNYVDYDDASVQGRLCQEVCIKHGKPIIVMEPVKGGSLVNLPDEAKNIFADLHSETSSAGYAIRFAASLENVVMTLSGMSSLEQMQDNIKTMQNFMPLSDKERTAVTEVVKIFKKLDLIPCTSCRYCVEGCPKKISIPDLFSCMNAKNAYHDYNSNFYYYIHTQNKGKASECIECGKCERACPQHLEIRKLLKSVSNEFEQQ